MSSQESIYLSKIPLQFSSKQTHSLEILITLVFLACSPHLIQNQPTTCDSPFKHSSSWLVSQPLHSPKLIRAHPQPQVLDVSPMATTVRSHPPIDWHIVPFTFQPSTVHCTVISLTSEANKKDRALRWCQPNWCIGSILVSTRCNHHNYIGRDHKHFFASGGRSRPRRSRRR